MHAFTRMLQTITSNYPNRNTSRKIITLKSQKSYEAYTLELKRYGITPYKQVGSAKMLCCHIKGGDEVLRHLKNHPSVHTIETDAKVKAHKLMITPSHSSYETETDTVPQEATFRSFSQVLWGVGRICAHKTWERARGKGVKVAILDTGISPHPNLEIAGGVNIMQKEGSFHDNNGHGTHVAGIVAAIGKDGMPYGVAPEVELYAVKALDKDGEGYVSDIIEGLEWCILNRINVVNMSLGLPTTNAVLHSMVEQTYRKGIVMVASVGNNGKNNNKIDFPARYAEVIAVAATEKGDQIALYSSRGKGIHVSAPGSDIFSTNYKGGFISRSGTSMAAAHVAGTVALLLAKQPKLSPRLARHTLMRTATLLKRVKQSAQGAGLISAYHALSSPHTQKAEKTAIKVKDNVPSANLFLPPQVIATSPSYCRRKATCQGKRGLLISPILVKHEVYTAAKKDKKVRLRKAH